MSKKKAARFVSRLTHNTLALVLAGGRGSRLGLMTDWRTKPAVPFGGKFRIIDFTLSNCLNSHIRRICVLTQYKSHSLIQHLLHGWNRFNAEHGEFIDVIPAQQWTGEDQWYEGTADAVHQSLDIVESYAPKYVLILAGDHIYNMDYGEMLAEHVESGADFTIACNVVSCEEATGFGVMQIDDKWRVTDFEEKPDNPSEVPGQPGKSLASMGIYVFSLDYLCDQLRRDADVEQSSHDFGKDIIPYALQHGDKIQAYQFTNPTSDSEAYWRDVGTLDAYYEANLELIATEAPIDIYDPAWPIMTYQLQLPPARFIGGGKGCGVENTMVSGGCVIKNSNVKSCILYSDVKVHDGCDLDGVLALPGCNIGAGSRLKNVILDNQCQVPEGTIIGEDVDMDMERFHVTAKGIVVLNRIMLGQGRGYHSSFIKTDGHDTTV